MRETYEIGPVPCDEDCAQVGSDNYSARARAECNAFRNQLRRVFGPEPDGAVLKVKANSHDFGTYYEVAVTFNVTDDAAADYAWRVQENAPCEWDTEARLELEAVQRIATILNDDSLV